MNGTDLITYKTIEGLDDINEVVSLQLEIWSQDVISPVPQLVAAIHNGGVVIGAFSDKKLVGFCYGFAGFKNRNTYLISHMTGVHPEFQNYGVGFQLKVKQREWAIAYGYQKIVWTYDPLEVRNGYFNLCKLGAYSQSYIPAYYGEMKDKLNIGLPADRLLIEWDICSNRVEKAILGGVVPCRTGNDFAELLTSDKRGEYPTKVEGGLNTEKAGYFVPVHTNIQLLKQTKLDVAMAWRYALRDVLSEGLLKGYVITGVEKKPNSLIHYYIIENKTLEEIHD